MVNDYDKLHKYVMSAASLAQDLQEEPNPQEQTEYLLTMEGDLETALSLVRMLLERSDC